MPNYLSGLHDNTESHKIFRSRTFHPPNGDEKGRGDAMPHVRIDSPSLRYVALTLRMWSPLRSTSPLRRRLGVVQSGLARVMRPCLDEIHRLLRLNSPADLQLDFASEKHANRFER